MHLPFRRIAIVNRGEPAMRLLHAVRELNAEHGLALRTIALFTDPDRKSQFVREADAAVCLGSATFVDPRDGQRKSRYLEYPALERALVESRAEAAWVGWGFVAEHAEFAELCRNVGVVFIGPDAACMRRAGDKIASKLLAEQAAVPVAPWSHGPVTTLDDARAHARRLGYPLMIKATAGGGGRGVRRVEREEQLADALASAQSEALKSFGSETLFLERAIVAARHVEVQLLADHHGNCWALGTRDCTLQRRNQKVLEEAPAVALDTALGAELSAAAVRFGRAAGYTNAGTVEFLFEPAQRAFYFMEMNTRLQVEHPVTEATTGVDLVKMQLFVAAGGNLGPEPPRTFGHAIEVRLNAEDPDRQFAPAPGRVEALELPTGPGLRIDLGIAQGDTIAPEFDSMIAKLIAYGKDRAEAIARLRRALLETAVVIRGGTTNQGFLLELLAHPDVASNRTDLGWLDRQAAGRPSLRPHAEVALIQAALDVYDHELDLARKNFFVSAAHGRPTVRAEIGHGIELGYGGQTYQLETRRLGPNHYRLGTDGCRVDVHVERQGDFKRWLSFGRTRHRVVSIVDGLEHRIEVDGVPHRISRDDGGVVRAPSPAVVLAIRVAPGDLVAAGATLVVLEAMKMEMAVVAPCAGRVRQVAVRPNVQVGAGAPLVLLDAEPTDVPVPAAERVRFRFESAPSGEPIAYPEWLAELQRLLLGYDLDRHESRALRDTWALARATLPVSDGAAWAAENAVLSSFADLLAVFEDEAPGASESRLCAEETLVAYLRSVNLAGRGSAPGFLDKLRRALVHYGVTELEPSRDLDEALYFAFRANRRMAECVPHVVALLGFRLDHVDELVAYGTPAFCELLDRLVAVTQSRYVGACDLARQARFRFFDRPLLEAARTRAYGEVEVMLSRLAEAPTDEAGLAWQAALVECPHPLHGVLSHAMSRGPRTRQRVALATLLRRFYRLHRLERLAFEETEGRSLVSADYLTVEGARHVIATHARLTEVKDAARSVRSVIDRYPNPERVSLDLYVAYEGTGIDSQVARDAVADTLAILSPGTQFASVCMAFAGSEPDRPICSFTSVPDGQQGYRAHPVYPGMHPMVAERLEVWRLEKFRTEQLPAPENIYLFHAIAHDNPQDERLFAFIDVYDTRPRRDDKGRVVELPQLEHLYLDAIAGIREFQARRAQRDRLHWNRILLYLRSPIDLKPMEMMTIARRLAPAGKNLGLEKTVVRLRMREGGTGALVDRVLHISDRVGTGLRLRFDALSNEPVRSLSPYAQKVVQMRRIGLVYAYEIVRMLTPARDAEHTQFPPGEFVEYDLDSRGRLEPVERPPGRNAANVVVGVIRNYTAKHPEGMTRVLLIGDGSREMGALGEPECLRLLAAFDLAQTLAIPVDWFPVSSGAKIAMDVGTEGLDWVASVLRRIVEFTQRGGEVNVVVTGVNVGAQSYWDAEATMLMHTKGILVMTPQASMVLTGKRALDYSGGVSADTQQGIGGFERIMGPNGQAQYYAQSIAEACQILFRHYEYTYLARGERFPRRAVTSDPIDRDVSLAPHASTNGSGFERVGDVFSAERNPGRKKPFDTRSVLRAVIDQDHEPLERWSMMRDAETAITWDAHLGGFPVCLIGIESKPLERFGPVPADGPKSWTGGTLFPRASKKVARAINAASGNRPVVVLANLSGFDGSPESMRELQLEYGAEIGRAVVNFDGPLVFCVISRYHGGAYVVFSRTLNPNLEVAALEGSHASVIGGAPAAAVVFPGEVKARTLADRRVCEAGSELRQAAERDQPRLLARYDEIYQQVFAEKQGEVAEQFDGVHSVQRALEVGSLHHIIPATGLRPYLVAAIERGMRRTSATELVGLRQEPRQTTGVDEKHPLRLGAEFGESEERLARIDRVEQ